MGYGWVNAARRKWPISRKTEIVQIANEFHAERRQIHEEPITVHLQAPAGVTLEGVPDNLMI